MRGPSALCALLGSGEGAAVHLSSLGSKPTQPLWERSPPHPYPHPQAKAPGAQIHLQAQDGAGGETGPRDPSLPRHHMLDPSVLACRTGLSRWLKSKLWAKHKDPGEAIRQTVSRAASGPNWEPLGFSVTPPKGDLEAPLFQGGGEEGRQACGLSSSGPPPFS